MTYAQFHDGFYKNRKVRRVGPEAAWLWAASIGYANENLTDGFIPVENLGELIEMDSKPRAKLIAKLVEAQLWEVVEGGWQVHDFLKWNFSREAVLAKRQANLDRVNKHRGKTAKTGDGNQRVTHYNDRDKAGDVQGDERSDKQGEKQPSSEPPVLIPNSPPPSPAPASRESAQAPAKAPPTEADEPPPAESESDPVVADDPQSSEAPKGLRLAYSAPSDSSDADDEASEEDQRAEALVFRIAMVPGARFNPNTASREERYAVGRILLADGVAEDLCATMGRLLLDPPKVWPWATQLNRGNFTRVSCAWLMGSKGGKVGHALYQLIDAARDAQDAERKRAEAIVTPRPAPLPEMSPADRLAAIARINARRVAAPGTVPANPPADAPEVTCG